MTKTVINPVGSNMTELVTNKGEYVLFSYSTPVAGKDSEGFFRTDKWYSKTTTRHINKYFEVEWGTTRDVAREVSQDYINQLV